MKKQLIYSVLLASRLKPGLCLTLFLCWAGTFSPAAKAEMEYSGQIQVAQEAFPALQSLICGPELFGQSGQVCGISAIRVIGHWAWISWKSGDRSGTSLLKQQDPNWTHVYGKGGVIGIEDTIAAGVPRRVAEFMIPTPALNISETRQLLSPATLEGFTAWELRIARNAIFARHGRRFQTRLLNDYFLTWPWYQPDPDYVVTRLSEVEIANAEIILAVEKRKGFYPPID